MSENRLKVIPIVGLHTKYLIQLDTGMIFTKKTGSLVPTFIENDELCVKLRPEGVDEDVTMSVTDLVITCIYGYTGLKPSRRLQKVPYDTYEIYPVPRPLIEVDPDNPLTDLMIGDLLYKRWNGSKYFVNEYGAVYSEPYGAFIKQTFNDREYRVVSLNKRSVRVHRIVWEAWNERLIPDAREIDHIDGLRWHNELSNLRAVTHTENLEFIDPDIRGRNIPRGMIKLMIAIVNYLKTSEKSYEEVAKLFGVDSELVTDLALTTKYDAVLKRHGFDVNTLPKNTKYGSLTPEKIRKIKEASIEKGMSDGSVMKEFGISANVLAGILDRQGMSDMPLELRNALIMYYHH